MFSKHPHAARVKGNFDHAKITTDFSEAARIRGDMIQTWTTLDSYTAKWLVQKGFSPSLVPQNNKIAFSSPASPALYEALREYANGVLIETSRFASAVKHFKSEIFPSEGAERKAMITDAPHNPGYQDYLQARFTPLCRKGYHPKHNPGKNDRIAKVPIRSSWNSPHEHRHRLNEMFRRFIPMQCRQQMASRPYQCIEVFI